MYPNNKLLLDIIDEYFLNLYSIILKNDPKTFILYVKKLLLYDDLNECIKWKINTYYPNYLEKEENVLENMKRIINYLEYILQNNIMIEYIYYIYSNIYDCEPLFFRRINHYSLLNNKIYNLIIKILSYHNINIDYNHNEKNSDEIKIAFILQTNQQYYSFPESLQVN